MAKACAVKWYSAIRFYDWADPKLNKKASPFTQIVWKNNALAGIGLARGNGANKGEDILAQQTAGNNCNYVVVFFDPGQSVEGDIRENVLPAAGWSRGIKIPKLEKGLVNVTAGGNFFLIKLIIIFFFTQVRNRKLAVLQYGTGGDL